MARPEQHARPARRRAALALGLLTALGCSPAAEPPAAADGAPLPGLLRGDEADLLAPRPALLPRWDADRTAEVWGFRNSPRLEHDWIAYFRRTPSSVLQQKWAEHPDGGFPMVTNALGLREDGPLPEAADLRVLVLGDSHTDGVVPNAESYANRLEALLSEARPRQVIDVVNAGTGLYTFPNYLGALLKFLPLEPDVVVVGVFAGNDFGEALRHWSVVREVDVAPRGEDYLRRLARAREVTVAGATGAETLAQGFNQLVYFDDGPDRVELALEAAEAYLVEIRALCERFGVRPVLLAIPAPLEGDAESFEAIHAATAEALGLDDAALGVGARLIDGLLERAGSAGFETLDGRDVLADAPGPQYWRRDQHLNVDGHARLARALFERLEDAGR